MILITGPMRSGTSALARIAHQAGYVMGDTMSFPRPGSDVLEWEDSELSLSLANHLLMSTRPQVSDLTAYFRLRLAHKQAQATTYGDLVRGFGVKCPFLLPFDREIREACHEAGIHARWIATIRDPSETFDSLDRFVSSIAEGIRECQRSNLYRMQHRIFDALETFSADAWLDTKVIRESPHIAAMALQE